MVFGQRNTGKVKDTCIVNRHLTRIHSSRMHTARSSSCHGGLHTPWEQAPLRSRHLPEQRHPPRCGPGDPLLGVGMEIPQARSPSTSPLGVGLETPCGCGPKDPPGQIPLNFPLGCGPGDSPGQIPFNFPLGCGPGVCPPGPDPPQLLPWVWAWKPARHAGIAPLPLESYCKACWDTTCNACWDSTFPPPVDRHTRVKT